MSRIVFTMGEKQNEEDISGLFLFNVPIGKTWYNRLRFWLFFKFFPFEFKEWLDE